MQEETIETYPAFRAPHNRNRGGLAIRTDGGGVSILRDIANE